MKTGGTLNFLKRAGAILMLVAVFASSCNKYADDFKQLNTKIDGLASSIGGMSTLVTDLATVKSGVAAAQAAIAAIPNPTASITALQTALNTVSTNVATINTTLNSLVTTVNGLPKLADVNAIATKVSADLTTQLAVTNKAIADAVTALKANEATVQIAILKAITDNNAVMDALVKGDLVANNAAINKTIADNNAIIAKAIADNNAAMNTLVTGDLTANNAAINALITANNAAINTAIVGNNTAMAALIQAQITALQAALQSSTDPTVVAVAGLQTLLNAQAATLATILANTVKTVASAAITGVPQQGVVLTAVGYDASLNVVPATSMTYVWSSASTSTGTYTAISGATASTYTPVLGDVGRFIKVSVLGTGTWAGSTTAVLSPATVAVGSLIPMTAIAATTSATSGLYKVGVKLTAGALTPTAASGATVTYQWISSATQYGVYAPISGATASTYTPVAADATTWINVVATGTGGYYNAVSPSAGPVGPIQYADITSAGFTMLPANNTVTITLTSGTFNTVALGLAKSQFVFLGEDAAAIGLGTLSYVSSTVVKFTTATSFNASSTNTVTILSGAMLTQASSAPTAIGTTEVMLTPVGSAIAGIPVPTGGVTYATPTITGTGFTGTVSWSPSISVGGTFLPATVYTATVSLTALSNYTFSGVTANSWTVTGGTVTNTAGSSSLTVVFPATSAIALPVANGVLSVTQFPLPVTGATAITTITGTNYTGVVTWSPALAGGKFQSGNIYTATIAIVPNLGYTTTGCVAPFWSTTALGTTVTYVTSATSLTVACPITL